MANETITLGGGCFWCVEAVFKRMAGVVSCTSGYAGGATANPTYEQVCSGTTGHAEVVRVEFDPAVVTLDAILRRFFQAHDPTTLNRQGADVGTQYRSAIYLESQEQRPAVDAVVADMRSVYRDPIVTEVELLDRFYPAEAYHQDYYERNPNAGYCRVVIAPKLKKLGL
ncbi:MAG: peptide-methionine (S)-S-oxide reductase [Spirochaetaceae bacterium]|nr:MAG: peptide-methionine (S)-S-oxide reductase [Spirochaetaceae bacterium]